MTNGHLPFGCHAWERYGFDFWKNYIDLSGVDWKKEGENALKKISEMRNSLEFADREIQSMKNSAENYKYEVDKMREEIKNMYSSPEWKVALLIQKIFKKIFPRRSIQRLFFMKFFYLCKKFVRFIKKNYGEVLATFNIMWRHFVLRKKRNINLQSKKIVYIDHSYHNKTLSNDFLLEYLKELYDVRVVWDESWKNDGSQFPDISFIDESYLGVVFFQSFPSKEILKNIKNDNIIFVPMYDAVPQDYVSWKHLYNVKMINFSKTLHRKLKRWRFESFYMQYFPKPYDFCPGKSNEVFFWQRITKFDIDVVEKLFGLQTVKMHIHTAIDPKHILKKPTSDQEKKYNITYSDWFGTREEMWELVKRKGIYIAPREYEGIGLSFLEAMAMGKAVVAVDNPTMNEYITHGKTGYLFNLSDPQEVNFANINEVQKNTYEYMRHGYERWKNDLKKISEFLRQE